VKLARFTREARSELLAQTAYYETIRKGLGARFRAEVERTAQLAVTFPLHGKPGPAGTRRRLVADFPFKIFYSEAKYGILILAVAGDHQFPEYWLSRIPKSDG
jgi:plasmid stabilization system protein ParE